MNNYAYERITECFNAFQNLLDSNKYVSHKMFEDYLKEYEDAFQLVYKNYLDKNETLYQKIMDIAKNGYTIISKYNEKYVARKLVEYKSYFDNMFKGIDDSIVLDDEQRKAIIIDEDYSLLIAGAGSGKTTTISAKVKYLIERLHVNPKKIILLSFTNKATDELDTRINLEFNLNVEVTTFHKLGMKFVRKLFDGPVKIASDGAMYNIISGYIKNNVFPNKNKLKRFMSIFKDYVHFSDKALMYDSFDDYFRDYTITKYEENKNNLPLFIKPRVKQRLKRFYSINGEQLKSLGETEIANYLYLNGYNYTYEELYPHKLDDDRSYLPDFTLNVDGLTIYIEYYGLTTLKKDGTYTTNDIKTYNKLIEKKKELHRKYNTDLIELYCINEDGTNYLDVLGKELEKRNLLNHPRTDKEVFYRLLETSKEVEYFPFIELSQKFINRFKEKGNSYIDFDKLIEKEKQEIVKYQLLFERDLYRYYQNKIFNEQKIDFNDMINYAYRGMEKVKDRHPYLDYEYVIIDEYQDISTQKYNMAKRLSDLFNAKIVAVGDDWQAIYSFSGADVNLFTNFYEMMGYAEIIQITRTYRNSQELIDVAGDFVSKNTEQFNKTLISAKHLEKPIEIYYYRKDLKNEKCNILNNILKSIYIKNRNSKVLVIGRYNNDIDDYINKGCFRKGPNDRIISEMVPNLNIDYLTIHSAKGLGYDEVILINALNNKYGFPCQIEDEPLLKTLDITKSELIEYPEERRLFYVALTRTKNRLYIICPYYPIDDRSDFIREISENDNILERVDL